MKWLSSALRRTNRRWELRCGGYGRGMQIRSMSSQAPLRVAAGTYILNSGLNKLDADDEKSKHLHEMAVSSYPFFENMDPQTFVKVLRTGEILLGGALLAPFVSSRTAGLSLAAFAATTRARRPAGRPPRTSPRAGVAAFAHTKAVAGRRTTSPTTKRASAT